MSDDGQSAVVVIALLGSPFSSAYAAARARGAADPLGHCAMHVATYGPARRWALDERTVAPDALAHDRAILGRSALRWESGALVAELDERDVWGRRVRGRVRFEPEGTNDLALDLDDRGAHVWWPAAPLGRVEVALTEPGLRFRGHGYHDANAGREPIEAGFRGWTWMRARAGGAALVTFDLAPRAGWARSFALRFDARGRARPFDAPAMWTLPDSRWGLARRARSDAHDEAAVVRNLEDGPFYARALVRARLDGSPVTGMHETLDAERLARPWARLLSRFRTTRWR